MCSVPSHTLTMKLQQLEFSFIHNVHVESCRRATSCNNRLALAAALFLKRDRKEVESFQRQYRVESRHPRSPLSLSRVVRRPDALLRHDNAYSVDITLHIGPFNFRFILIPVALLYHHRQDHLHENHVWWRAAITSRVKLLVNVLSRSIILD